MTSGQETEVSVQKHAMNCFARYSVHVVASIVCSLSPLPCRMVKALLGDSAIAIEKLETGPSLTILGVEASVSRKGLKCIPDKKKRKRWIARIKAALRSGKLTSGEASKLSGALQWATQRLFRRLGRAMVRPIYK